MSFLYLNKSNFELNKDDSICGYWLEFAEFVAFVTGVLAIGIALF